MLTDREKEAARLGMEVLDQVLVTLGGQPVLANPDFRVGKQVLGETPNFVLEKPGAAPLRFVLGQELDIWVGPCSEVVFLEVSEAKKSIMYQLIEKVLLSSVACKVRKNSVAITLQLPGEKPWNRVKFHSRGLGSDLEPFYAPYFPGGAV